MKEIHTITASQPKTSQRRRMLTLIATTLGIAVVQLDVSVVNVAIKPIGVSFGGGISGLQWVVSAYTLAFAALILTAGALGDRIGARRVFMAGFVLFTLASACCGLAPNLTALIIARMVQGIGAAILVPCSLTLLNHGYDTASERTRAIGLWAAGASVALAGGPLVGGLLTAGFGWRSIFFINAPIGLIGIWLTWRYANETTRSTDRGVDIGGQAAAIIMLGALAWATIFGGERGFGNKGVLAGYAVAVLAAIVFVLLEGKQKKPMLPLTLFRSATFSIMSSIGFLINIGFYGLIFVLSLFFQQAQHLSVFQTGLAFAPMTAVVLIGNTNSRKIAAAIGELWTLRLGALLVSIGGVGLLVLGLHTAYLAIVLQLLMIGIGLGLMVPVFTSSLLGSVPKPMSGVASGALNTARQAGSVIGVALCGSLIAKGRLVGGLHQSLVILVGLMIASAFLTIFAQSKTNADTN